jgi:hypothetical protein
MAAVVHHGEDHVPTVAPLGLRCGDYALDVIETEGLLLYRVVLGIELSFVVRVPF